MATALDELVKAKESLARLHRVCADYALSVDWDMDGEYGYWWDIVDKLDQILNDITVIVRHNRR